MLRSSAAVLQSPGGLAGLINIVPRTYDQRQTRIDTLLGSDRLFRTHLSHGDTVGKISYAVAAGYRHTDGPDHEYARENLTDLYARLVARPVPEWTLSLTALGFFGDRQLQLGEHPASTTLQTRRDHFDPMHGYLFVTKATYEPSDRAVTEIIANAALRRYTGHRSGRGSWLEKDYEYGGRVTQVLRLGEANTLRVGALYNRWVSPTGKRYYVGRRGDLETLSGFVVDEHDFGRLLVNAGYRLSRTRVNDFGGFSIEGSSAGLTSVRVKDEWEEPLHTLTLGAAYELTDVWTLFGNVTWGQVASRVGMLTASLDRPGTETRTKVDLGVRREWEAFGSASLTGFFVDQKDAAVLSGGTVTVAGDDFALHTNADRRNYGLELDVRSRRFDNGLQLFANAVVMRTRDDRRGDWHKDKEVPEVILGGGASWLVGDVELSVLVKHIGRYENERFMPGGSAPADLGDFTDVSAKVTYYFGKTKQHSVFFGVDNLCNRHYSTVAGWPDEGVRFKTGLSLQF